MDINQFADTSRKLSSQVRIAQDLVNDDSFKEAGKALKTAEKTCCSLESLMESQNKVQNQIVNNRRREMQWIDDAIQQGMAKTKSKVVRKRTAQ